MKARKSGQFGMNRTKSGTLSLLIVEVLTETTNPTDYIKKMRKRDEMLSQGWGQIVTPLFVETSGGKQKLNCANAKGLLRIIQSIPSPKAEPFKNLRKKDSKKRLTNKTCS